MSTKEKPSHLLDMYRFPVRRQQQIQNALHRWCTQCIWCYRNVEQWSDCGLEKIGTLMLSSIQWQSRGMHWEVIDYIESLSFVVVLGLWWNSCGVHISSDVPRLRLGKKMSLLNKPITERLGQLMGAGRTIFEVEQEETEIGVATHLWCFTAVKDWKVRPFLV